MRSLKNKFEGLSSEIEQQAALKERLKLQFNLMKLQVVTVMQQMDQKSLEVAEVKIDFKGKL